jgi:hypothetical protein
MVTGGFRKGSVTVRKVFCIGFHKTGTTSMEQALRILGYRVTGPDHVHDPEIARTLHQVTAELSHRYDAFQDNPWPLVYKEMDALHPGSRFILTVRDEEKWYDSNRNHFRGKTTPMRELVYGPAAGRPKGNEEIYKARPAGRSPRHRSHPRRPVGADLRVPRPPGPGPAVSALQQGPLWLSPPGRLGSAPALGEARPQNREASRWHAAPGFQVGA